MNMSEEHTEHSGGADVRAAKIIVAAERYVRARTERKRLEQERNRISCARQAPRPDEAIAPGDRVVVPDTRVWAEHSCWKLIHAPPGDGYNGGWQHAGNWPPDHWCEPCQKRHALHLALIPANREVVDAYNSLRRAVTGSRS